MYDGIPVDQAIDIYNPNYKWYPIPGFNGYEYSFVINRIRSVKNPNKYKYGYLIKVDNNNVCRVSNNNNSRIDLKLSEAKRLIEEDPNMIYPRETNDIDIFGNRNQRAFIKPDEEPTVGVLISKAAPVKDVPVSDFGFSFSVIE